MYTAALYTEISPGRGTRGGGGGGGNGKFGDQQRGGVGGGGGKLNRLRNVGGRE